MISITIAGVIESILCSCGNKLLSMKDEILQIGFGMTPIFAPSKTHVFSAPLNQYFIEIINVVNTYSEMFASW